MIGYYHYDKLGDSVLITNDLGFYAILTKDEFQLFALDAIPRDTCLWQELCDKFFCTDESKESFYQKVSAEMKKSRSYLFSPTSLYILAMTNMCNNSCIYCQARGNAAPKNMTLEVAEQVIRRISETPSEKLTIEFQGGEPLANFEAIKGTVNYCEQYLKHKEVHYSLVSNLAYVNDEIASYLAEKRISVSTSLDGPKDLHDTNRPLTCGGGSYDNMIRGLQILRNHGISVGAIQTTTKHSLYRAKDIIKEFVDLGFRDIFIRPLSRFGVAAINWESVGYSPEEYVKFYKECLNEVISVNKQGTELIEAQAGIFLGKIINGESRNYMELRSPCGAALGQIAFTANGDVFTCDEGRMLAEIGDNTFRLGNVFENGYNEWIESSVCKAVCTASLLETLPRCSDCVFQPYCGVCPVANYANEGRLISKNPRNYRCSIMKGIITTIFSLLQKEEKETMDILYQWAY